MTTGVNLALDKLFPTSTEEQLKEVPEPEQLEVLPEGLPGEPPVKQPAVEPPPPPMGFQPEITPSGEAPPPPSGFIPVSRIIDVPPEGIWRSVKEDDGAIKLLNIKADGSIYRTDLEIPSIPAKTPIKVGNISPTGEFVPLTEDELWEQIFAAAPKGEEFKFGTMPIGLTKLAQDFPIVNRTIKVVDWVFNLFGGAGAVFYQAGKSGKPVFSKEVAEEINASRTKILNDIQQRMKAAKTEEERQAISAQESKNALNQVFGEGELRQEFEELPEWEQILYELPAWLATGGISGTALKSTLAGLAAKRGVKGAIGKGVQIATAPVVEPLAGLEALVGKILTLPIRGGADIVRSLRTRGDKALAKEANTILERALRGETIPDTELKAIGEKSPELLIALENTLKDIKPTLFGAKGEPIRFGLVPGEAPVGKIATPGAPPKVTTVPDLAQPQSVLDKLIKLIEVAKPARKQREIDKTEALSAKIPQLADALNSAQSFDDLARASAALRGKLPPSALIVPVEKQLTEAEIGSLIGSIKANPDLVNTPLTKFNTLKALEKLVRLGEVPTEGEIKLLENVFGPQLTDALLKKRSLGKKAWELTLDILGLPKAIVASWDLSAPLRQGGVLLPANLRQAGSAFKTQLKAFYSEAQMNAINKAIRANRFYDRLTYSGLELTSIGKTAARLSTREEAFMTRFARFIPLVRRSERAYVTYLNKLRADVFYKYAEMYEKTWTDQQFKDLARFINWSTGRGPIGRAQDWVPIINQIFFAPRLQTSRISLPLTMFIGDKAVRKIAIKNMTAFVGSVSSIIGLLTMSGVATTELDPRSSDFGKIRIGNTRLDPWAGFQQYVKLIARMITGEMKTDSQKIIETNNLDTLLRFLRSKYAPVFGLAWDVLKGETFLGEELSLKPESVREQLKERLVPLFIQDVMDALNEDGWLGGVVASPGFFGVGVVSYPARTYLEWSESVSDTTGQELDTTQLIAIRPHYNEAEASWKEYNELPSGKVQQAYLENNPKIAASLYFWGEKKSLVNAEESWPFVQKMLDELGYSPFILPIRAPFEPYDSGGKTDDEVFSDLVKPLPKYLSDSIVGNAEAWKTTNMPEFIDIVAKLQRDDEAILHYYNNTMDGKSTKEREIFRRDNPMVDMLLNFWGHVKTLQSGEAGALLANRIKELGIPREIVPAFQKGGGGLGSLK